MNHTTRYPLNMKKSVQKKNRRKKKKCQRGDDTVSSALTLLNFSVSAAAHTPSSASSSSSSSPSSSNSSSPQRSSVDRSVSPFPLGEQRSDHDNSPSRSASPVRTRQWTQDQREQLTYGNIICTLYIEYYMLYIIKIKYIALTKY